MTKKENERLAFECFLRLSGQCFDGFECIEPPEPDIVAWRGDDRFGVEITNFYRPHEKQRESEEDKLVNLACERYMAKGGPCLNANFHWVPSHDITKTQGSAFADEVVNLIEANVPQLRDTVEFDWSHFSEKLMGSLHSVTINRLVDYKRNYWNTSRAGCVPSWDPRILQAELDRKNSKPALYQEKYAETWLIVVSTGHEPSAWLEMTDLTRAATYRSTFGRAFMISSFPSAVFELHLEGKTEGR